MLISGVCLSQTEKTLLWEISGNGLTKKSYVYGTFHVNEKISYHLTDEFYKHLLEADIVSNESNPENWDVIFDFMLTNTPDEPGDLYRSFKPKPAKSQDLVLLFNNMSIYDRMTSGVEGAEADYQESTVLDMFIYQTGRKYNKKVIGLEDAKESFLTLLRAESKNIEGKEEKRQQLQKLIKNKNYMMAMKDYYRDKDIVMLDSIYKLLYSEDYHKKLIVDRNIIMTKSIDSLAHQGSLFSAVGAAHLAGKDGILQLLINKGYTVKPVFGSLTKKGESQKETIEKFFPTPLTDPYETTDGMIKLPLFKNSRQLENNLFALDITNGGLQSIKRLPLEDYLLKDQSRLSHKSLDSLFYENIPGTILEKNFFDNGLVKGYDIKNKTKAGNYQHSRYYVTPLELIVINLSGTGEYVKQYESSLFDKTEVKNKAGEWRTFEPIKGGFSVSVPGYFAAYGDTKDVPQNVSLRSFDPQDNAYYFVTESTVNDVDLLEDTVFEHNRLHNEYYLNTDMPEMKEDFTTSTTSFESESEKDGKKVQLHSIISGNKYYLLGAVNAPKDKSNAFFNSFKNKPFQKETFVTYKDTATHYSVSIPEKANVKLINQLNGIGMGMPVDVSSYKSKNKFESEYKSVNFISQNGRQISMVYNKYHKYFAFESQDSLKAYFRRTHVDEIETHFVDSVVTVALDDFNPNRNPSSSDWYKLTHKENKEDVISQSDYFDEKNHTYVFESVVSQAGSTQAVKTKTIVKGNRFYELSTLIDRNYKNDDDFIETVYKTLTPESIDSVSVFDDKLQLFLEDVSSENDTLRFSAIESIPDLDLRDSDWGTIKNFLETFSFKDSENEAAASLLEKAGALNHPEVIPYLEEKYKREGTKTSEQFSILYALARKATPDSFKKVGELLEYDLPVSDESYDIEQLFNLIKDKPEASQVLYPALFQYFSISEYNPNVVAFCTTLFEKNLAAPKKIKAFKKLILTNAKLEFKKVVSWKEKNNTDNEDSYGNDDDEEYYYDDYDQEAPITALSDYIRLLSYLPSDAESDALMQKIRNFNLPELNLELLRIEVPKDNAPRERIETNLTNSKTKFPTVLLLQKQDKYGLLKGLSDEEIAESGLRFAEPSIKEKDSLELVDTREGVINEKPVRFYFYKITKEEKEDDETSTTTELQAIAFVTEKGKVLPNAVEVFDSKELTDDKEDLEKLCTAMYKAGLNDDHPRARYEKEEEGEGLFGIYD